MSLKNPVINWLTERSRDEGDAVLEEFRALIPEGSEIIALDECVGDDTVVWGFVCPTAVMLYVDNSQ